MRYLELESYKGINFNIINKPYLIKGYATNWNAYKKWSFEFLKKLDPNLIINTTMGNAHSGKKHIISYKFKDYIEDIITSNTTAYLGTFHLFKRFPNLKKDINYKIIKNKATYYHLLGWIGPRGTITGFHADWSENLNIQIKGRKIFYLVSPEDNSYMYINNRFDRLAITSYVDLKDFDELRFPLFKKAKLIKVILEEGDAIYIPRGWWHYVESLDPSISVSFHYWKLKDFFRDLILGFLKIFFHDIGLYKKSNCTCHSQDHKGKRIKRSL